MHAKVLPVYPMARMGLGKEGCHLVIPHTSQSSGTLLGVFVIFLGVFICGGLFFLNVLALAGLRWKISDSYQSKGLVCSFRVCLISSSDILRLSLGFIFFECCFHVKSWICVCEIPCWMLEVQPLYL